MPALECKYGSFSTPKDTVPVPENLKGKDVRADSAARAAVFSATSVLENMQQDINLESLNIIVLNREGCESHVKKISDGIAKKAARQGFFARGGPQTLATYTALALGCHGSAFTIVADQEALDDTITTAMFFADNGVSAGTILTVVVRQNEGGYKAESVLITPVDATDPASNDSQHVFSQIRRKLSSVFEAEVLQ